MQQSFFLLSNTVKFGLCLEGVTSLPHMASGTSNIWGLGQLGFSGNLSLVVPSGSWGFLTERVSQGAGEKTGRLPMTLRREKPHSFYNIWLAKQVTEISPDARGGKLDFISQWEGNQRIHSYLWSTMSKVLELAWEELKPESIPPDS